MQASWHSSDPISCVRTYLQRRVGGPMTATVATSDCPEGCALSYYDSRPGDSHCYDVRATRAPASPGAEDEETISPSFVARPPGACHSLQTWKMALGR